MKRRSSGAIGLAIWLAASAAAADKTPQERALAETLFREGKALVSAGKVAEACPKFAESHRLDPTPGLLMYLATCHEEEGKTATAWAEFSEAVVMAGKAHQAEREKQAQKAARALEAKLSKISVKAPSAPAGLEITIDGVPLSNASLGVGLPFDPGPHAIEAKAPGKQNYTSTVVVEPGPIVHAIEIPPLTNEAPPPIAAPPPQPPPDVIPPPPPPGSGSGQRTFGVVLGGVGLLSIGAGAFFGLRASSQAKDADKECSGKFCTPEGLAGHDDAQTSALVSTITFGVGGALLAAGIYLFLSAPKAVATGSLRLTPSFARDGARVITEVTW